MWNIKQKMISLIAVGLLLGLSDCSPVGDEPEAVFMEAWRLQQAMDVKETDLGWRIEFTAFEIAIRDIEFTIQGETHTRRHRWQDLFIKTAYAHPGHYAGGEVTGELRGDFLIDPLGEETDALGEAQLLLGDYNGMNFTFRKATVNDGLAETSALNNHTAFMKGTATYGSETVPFTAIVDVEDNTQMVGGIFDLVVKSETDALLALKIVSKDDVENKHLFDGIDFKMLGKEVDGSVRIQPGDEAHNRLRKALIRHNFYRMEVLPAQRSR